MRKLPNKNKSKNKPKNIGGKSTKKVKVSIAEKQVSSIVNIDAVNSLTDFSLGKYNGETYTTQAGAKTAYTSTSGDELSQTYTTSQSNSVYDKLVETEEATSKRSEMLPDNKSNNNASTIIILIGVAAFAALLLLLI